MSTSASLSLALLETPHRFGDVEGALARLDVQLEEAHGVELALLSEASLTGYVSPDGDFDISRFAEALDGPTVTALSGLARKHRLSIGASIVEREGPARFNTYVIVGADGSLRCRYRKRHPWYPEEWATAGKDPPPRLHIAGLAVTVAVCFDVHFLDEDASDALRWADALIFPSAWVSGDAQTDKLSHLLPSLARRHGIWIANPNWAPSIPSVRGQGASCVVSPEGSILAQAPRGPGEKLVRATLTRHASR